MQKKIWIFAWEKIQNHWFLPPSKQFKCGEGVWGSFVLKLTSPLTYTNQKHFFSPLNLLSIIYLSTYLLFIHPQSLSFETPTWYHGTPWEEAWCYREEAWYNCKEARYYGQEDRLATKGESLECFTSWSQGNERDFVGNQQYCDKLGTKGFGYWKVARAWNGYSRIH